MSIDLKIVSKTQPDGPAIWFLNGLSFIRISVQQTGGAFALVEDHLPAGRATPYHVHEREDEIFLPRGIPHGFRADTPSRMLILTTPGGFDRFVMEVGVPAESLTIPPPSVPDFARLTTIAARYGIGILGPLPK